MIKKITSYIEALDAIAEIDKEITELLDSDEKYGELMLLMQKRLVYISEINRLKDNTVVTDEIRARAKEVYDSGNAMQAKIKNKKDKIKTRLDKNKRLEIKNKKLNY
jgi:hypothetical protein